MYKMFDGVRTKDKGHTLRVWSAINFANVPVLGKLIFALP